MSISFIISYNFWSFQIKILKLFAKKQITDKVKIKMIVEHKPFIKVFWTNGDFFDYLVLFSFYCLPSFFFQIKKALRSQPSILLGKSLLMQREHIFVESELMIIIWFVKFTLRKIKRRNLVCFYTLRLCRRYWLNLHQLLKYLNFVSKCNLICRVYQV